MLDVSPFYSVILGFRGNTDSLPLFPWVLEPMLCQPFWWPIIFLFFIVLFFWCCFPKSFLLTFHSGVSLEGWPSISLPLRLLILTFFRLNFLAVLLFVIFPRWAESIPAKLKVFPATSLYSSSFGVARGTSPLFMNFYSPSLLVPFCITRWLRRTYLSFVLCVSWCSFWTVLIST